MLAAGPYRWPAYELRGYGVMTNRVGSGAYRGPGAPPAAFAVETVLDELAAELGIDPIELRLRNVLVEGDTGIDGQPFPVFGAKECLERMRDHELWRRRAELPDGEGVGVAIGYWPGGLEPAAAACRLDADGGLTIITGAVDMTGTETTFATIAAEAFGLAPDRVRVTAGDTASTPFAGLSGGSKVTYTVGRAVQRAADDARRRLLEVAAIELEIAPEDLEIVDGSVRPIGTPSRAMSVEELAQKVLTFGSPHAPVEGYAGVAQTSRAPSAAAHLIARPRGSRDGRGDACCATSIAQDVGRDAQPGARRGPAARRHGAGPRLGALRGARARRARPAAHRLVRRLRDPGGGQHAADRARDRRGPGAGRPVRREGDRRGARHRGGAPPWRTRSPRRWACGCASCR